MACNPLLVRNLNRSARVSSPRAPGTGRGGAFGTDLYRTGQGMRKATYFALAAALAFSAARAEAQVFTPPYQSPVSGGDLGVYISDDALGAGLGVEGILRMRMTSSDLGLRVGIAEVPFDGTDVTLGVDWRNPLRLSGTAPLVLALTAGGQAALGDVNGFGAQVGLSVGGDIRSPEVTFTPYIHPRLALVDIEDESELQVLADIGVDLSFARNLLVRFDANLGDGADFGIGLAWRR